MGFWRRTAVGPLHEQIERHEQIESNPRFGSDGDAKCLASAEVISAVNARTNILERRQPDILTPARLAFTHGTSVFPGGEEVRAQYFGRGHTHGDAVICFPAHKTIHTGDLPALPGPPIDYASGGSIVAWTRTLDEVMKLDFDIVIPGHGNVTDRPGRSPAGTKGRP